MCIKSKKLNKNLKRYGFIRAFIVFLLCFLISISFFPISSFANGWSSSAGAKPLKPITLAQVRAMHFATIFPDTSGDVITLTPASARSATGGSTFAGVAYSGQFFARGEKNSTVSISFSSGDTLTGPGTAMPLDNFIPDTGFVFQFPSNGKQTIYVGADLTVGAFQMSGQYNGNYVITLEYQ